MTHSNALVPISAPVTTKYKEVSGELLTHEDAFHVASRTRPLQTRSVITKFIEPGTTIEGAVKQVLVDPVLIADAHVELNGYRVAREHWRLIKPKFGSLLTITCVPHSSSILRLVAFVTLASFAGPAASALWPTAAGSIAAGTAGFGTILAYGGLKAGIIVLGSLLINALIPPPKPDTPEQFPYLNNSANKARLFKSVPRVFGKHRMTPDLAATPFTELIDSKEQYLTVLLCWGYGPIRLTGIRIGDVSIDLYDNDEVIFEHYGVFTEDSLPLNQTWSIESDIYPIDIHQRHINAHVSEGFPVRRSSAPNASKVVLTYGFPGGLVKYDKKGKKKDHTVSFRIDKIKVTTQADGTSISGTPIVVVRKTETRKTRSPIRLIYEDVIPSSDQDETIHFDYEFTRITVDDNPDSDDTEISNLQWHHIKSIQTGRPVKFTEGAYSVVRVRASTRFVNTLPAISGIVEAYIPSYNPTTRTFDALRLSDNPADCFYEVLRSAASARLVPEDQINLESIIEYWEYCRDNSLRFNHIVRDVNGIWEVLQDITRVGFASPGRPDSKWGIIIDRQQTVPRQVFTPRNTRGYQLQKSFDRVPHAVRVKFSNRAQDFRPDEAIYFRPGFTDANAKEYVSMSIPGVTDATHAWKVARFYLAQKVVRPETHTFEAYIDYLTCERGSLVQIQQDVVAIGQVSGRILEIDNESTSNVIVTVDCNCFFAGSRAYGIRIRRNDNTQVVVNVAAVGLDSSSQTNKLSVSKALEGVNVGDLIVFGVYARESIPLLVVDIKPKDEVRATLECVSYDEDLYNLEAVPDFDAFVTNPILPASERLYPLFHTFQDQSDLAVQRLPDGSVIAQIVVSIVPLLASVEGIETIETRWRKYSPNVEGEEAWEYREDSHNVEQLVLAGVDAPADIIERDAARAHIVAGTFDEEFTYCIQGRYIYEQGRGMGV